MIGMVSSQQAARGPDPADTALRARPWSGALTFPQPARRERSAADLARMIESEIIPRLMLAHAASEAGSPPSADAAVDEEAVDAFVHMTLSHEAPALMEHIKARVHDGLALQSAYVELLVPTARRLGDDWNDDRISFTDVTIGLSRLQQVVRGLAVSFPGRDVEPEARAACFATAAGEHHAFGLFLVEDQFRRAGWRTQLDTAATREDAAQAVALDWFDVFGLSATSDTSVADIASTIALVRKGSLNPRLFVLVGGGLFVDNPGLAADVGADAFAESAAVALSEADKAVQRLAFV